MRAVVALFLVSSACSPPTEAARWKAAYSAAECRALVEREAYINRCYGGHFLDDKYYVGDLQCMPYSSSKRFRGVWVIGLEYSGFFPNASDYVNPNQHPDAIWLQSEPPPSAEMTAAGQGAESRAYLVEFIGRQSLCDSTYGHEGLSPKEIITERFLSISPLPIP